MKFNILIIKYILLQKLVQNYKYIKMILYFQLQYLKLFLSNSMLLIFFIHYLIIHSY